MIDNIDQIVSETISLQAQDLCRGRTNAIDYIEEMRAPTSASNSAVLKFDAGECSEATVAKQIEIMASQVVEFATKHIAHTVQVRAHLLE